jgi:hypothetical protein
MALTSGDAPGGLQDVRRFILGILLFGLTGTAAELVLINHIEDPWQIVPVALIGAAALCLAWYGLRGGGVSLRALQCTMLFFLLSGALGVVFHSRASVEFQRDLNPSIESMALLWKVMTTQSPPALAPGMMVQLGLLGLAYTYRHPAFAQRSDQTDDGKESVT